jgi:hypothetical protein
MSLVDLCGALLFDHRKRQLTARDEGEGQIALFREAVQALDAEAGDREEFAAPLGAVKPMS